jgi:hypothetical protein
VALSQRRAKVIHTAHRHRSVTSHAQKGNGVEYTTPAKMIRMAVHRAQPEALAQDLLSSVSSPCLALPYQSEKPQKQYQVPRAWFWFCFGFFDGLGIFSYAFGLGFLRLRFGLEPWSSGQHPSSGWDACSPGSRPPLCECVWRARLTLAVRRSSSLSLSLSDELDEDSSELLSPTGRALW